MCDDRIVNETRQIESMDKEKKRKLVYHGDVDVNGIHFLFE